MTITVREKGQDARAERRHGPDLGHVAGAEDRGDEGIADFDIRYAKKLYGPMIAGVSAEQMAAGDGDVSDDEGGASAKMSAEGGKIEGTPILTTTTMDAVKSAGADRGGSEGQSRTTTASQPGRRRRRPARRASRRRWRRRRWPAATPRSRARRS